MIAPRNSITTTTLITLLAFCLWLGMRASAQQPNAVQPASPTASPAIIASPTTTASPDAKPKAFISYIKEGALWLMREDGTEDHQIVPAPEEAAIANQVWAADGSKIYFNVGRNVFAYVVKDQKVESLSVLQVPEGIAVERFELASDGKTLLFQTIDTNDALSSVPRVFALTPDPVSSRELSVDEYHALAPVQSATIRNMGELSVSPDGKSVLFSEAVDKDIQLFIADIETGKRQQITDLNLLEGFEPGATPDGGRRIIEATWAPDNKHIVFVPAQSCSEFGLCSGKMFMIEAWSGTQLQLASEFTAGISQEWNPSRSQLIYDDGGNVLLADTQGQVKQLAVGNQPRWQPAS